MALGLTGATAPPLAGLAWVHLVALGYLTLVSLAVLVHVLHGMLDLEWVHDRCARWSLLPFTLGTWALAAGFWTGRTDVVAGGATAVGAALALYLALAFATLARWRPDGETSPMVPKAFGLVLAMLTATAVLGVGMGWALAGHGGLWWLSVAPRLHAHLGAIGWLSLLVVGVSMHTVKPITGGKTDATWKHIVSSSLLLLGLLGVLGGLASGLRLMLGVGGVLAAAGTLLYVADLAGILARSRVAHRPPQAFLAASATWFLVAAVLGLGVLAGQGGWRPAYAYVALIGWLGQMVVGHLHHIGIRVLATVARGEDDETRPGELLAAPLSWGAFVAFQVAIAGGAAGMVAGHSGVVAAAGASGLVGWLLMGANVVRAWRVALAPAP